MGGVDAATAKYEKALKQYRKTKTPRAKAAYRAAAQGLANARSVTRAAEEAAGIRQPVDAVVAQASANEME